MALTKHSSCREKPYQSLSSTKIAPHPHLKTATCNEVPQNATSSIKASGMWLSSWQEPPWVWARRSSPKLVVSVGLFNRELLWCSPHENPPPFGNVIVLPVHLFAYAFKEDLASPSASPMFFRRAGPALHGRSRATNHAGSTREGAQGSVFWPWQTNSF